MHAIDIVAFGARTPVGTDAALSLAAARSGRCGFREHPFLVDAVGEPVRMAPVRGIDVQCSGLDRYEALLTSALDAALLERPRSAGKTIGLLLALPPNRPGRPVALADELAARIPRRLGAKVQLLEVFETGHAAALQGIERAAASLQRGTLAFCAVAAADSYLDPETLHWLESSDQLHGAGRFNNAWGFVPGEAGAAMLLASSAWPTDTHKSLGRLRSVCIAREENLIKTDAVCIGAGLTRAFNGALRALAPGEQASEVYCDLNGEAYRAEEYGFAALRGGQRLRAATDFHAPADCWGDVGAAGSLLHIGLALARAAAGCAKGPTGLVTASSEGGERGAALIDSPLGERE